MLIFCWRRLLWSLATFIEMAKWLSLSLSLNSKGPFGWMSGKVEEWKIMRGWKIFSFPSCVFGFGGVEKWEGGKLFCLIEEKNRRMKNVIYINWLLYPCYIICKNIFICTYYIILNLSHHIYKFILLFILL